MGATMNGFKLDGFKKYIYRGRAGVPKVVIRKNGQVGFNSAAVQKYDLDCFEYIIFYISDKRDRVAVQFTNNEKTDGIIKIQKRKGSFAFSARNFLSIYDIPWSITENFDFIWNDSGKVAIFNCRQTGGCENEKVARISRTRAATGSDI